MTVLTTEFFLKVAGGIVLLVALVIARQQTHPRRWGTAAFWLILALLLMAGPSLPPVLVGYGVLLMTALAALRQVGVGPGAPAEPGWLAAEVERLGHRLLAPVLLIPLVAVVVGTWLPLVRHGDWRLVATREASQVGIGLGAAAALLLALRWTRDRPMRAIGEGGRLLQLLGWTLLLPPMLGALGGVFARAGVGEVIADLVASALPVQHPWVAVVAYCGGMALFTGLLGNAFAAFPVLTLGLGLPFIVRQHGGDAAIMGALGMLSGYCGTLVTPMAANFNLVPVKLLELDDDFAVIKAQAPMAAAIWLFTTLLMGVSVYRF